MHSTPQQAQSFASSAILAVRSPVMSFTGQQLKFKLAEGRSAQVRFSHWNVTLAARSLS